MTKKLRLLLGLPCSGKTTYAMKLLKDEENWFRVSRDDIRMTMFGTEHNPHIENFVSKIQNMLILKALKSDMNVVIDNCNIRQAYRNDLYNLASLVGDVLYEEVIFDTSLQECMARNKVRSRVVPEDVIIKFAKEGRDVLWGKYKPKTQFLAAPERNILHQDESLPKIIVVDLDGTMALMNGRNPYDASTCDKDLPHKHVVNIVKEMHDLGYKVIFLSGREDKFEQPTRTFLWNNFVEECYNKHSDHPTKFHRSYELFMRKTGDQRKDVVIKSEIYEAEIKNKYFIAAWFDDRLQICEWLHREGLPLFRVGDPNADF